MEAEEKLKKVVAYLQGGIGNQLFVLFAALSVAIREDNAHLILDKSLLSHSRIQHPGNLEDMEIRIGSKILNFEINKRNKPIVLIYFARIFYRIASKNPLLRRFLKQYRSKLYGFDPQLNEVEAPISLVGYFQTHKYLDQIALANSKIEIGLNCASGWFRATKNEINQAGSTVAIHLRRGDYAVNKETIGMLADEYFIGVLSLVNSSETIDKVYIFSDSIDAAELLLSKISASNCKVVVPPDSVSPAESMLLMRECNFKIISNSTFSWWSGYLSDNASSVFAPTPWFLNHEEPTDLVPGGWKRVEAIWVH